MAEKKTLYSEAQQLVGKIIAKQESPNPTQIRTLLRMSCKQQDYHYSEQHLMIDERLVEKSDFNISMNSCIILTSLIIANYWAKLSRKCAIVRKVAFLLQKLFITFISHLSFEDAHILSEHIQKLIVQKRTQSKKEHRQDRSEVLRQ